MMDFLMVAGIAIFVFGFLVLLGLLFDKIKIIKKERCR